MLNKQDIHSEDVPKTELVHNNEDVPKKLGIGTCSEEV